MIVTFYSFKGGAGRTLALGNIAVVLAQLGRKVLAVDFDLEAPGLSEYMRVEFDLRLDQHEGLLDMLRAAAVGKLQASGWRTYAQRIAAYQTGSLSLITSGRADEAYPGRLLDFDWARFFAERGGGAFIESLRNAWLEEYDFVLIDSRTGITDIGGICTIQLPDVIVAVFTASEQSVAGVIDVVRRAQAGRQALAYDRPQAAVIPLPSRFDTRTEYQLAQRWLDEFADRFSEFYETWLPKGLSARDMLERTKLPYIAYYSFGEQLPVLHERGTDPESLSYALRASAQLLDTRLAGAREILAGVTDGGKQPQHPLAGISASERELAHTPDAELAWQVLTRMVRIVPQQSGPPRFEPATFKLAWIKSARAAEIVSRLPAVRVAKDGTVSWADGRVAEEWQRLHEVIAADMEFLLWTQWLRTDSTGLSGPRLTEALDWYERRKKDLTEQEQRLVEHGRAGHLAGPPRPRIAWAHAVHALAFAVVFASLGAVAILLGHAGIPRRFATSWPQALVAAVLCGMLGAALDLAWIWRGLRALRHLTISIPGGEARFLLREASRRLGLIGYQSAYSSDTAAHFRAPHGASPPLPAATRRITDDTAVYDVVLLIQQDEDADEVLVASGPRGVVHRLVTPARQSSVLGLRSPPSTRRG